MKADAEEEVARPVVYLSRRTALVGGAIIGVGMAMTIAAVVWIALAVNDVQNGRIEDNENRNRQQARQLREQRRITEELRQLTNPTDEEYRRQFRRGIGRCLREPSCRRLFPTLSEVAAAAPPARATRRTDPAPMPEVTTDPHNRARPPRPRGRVNRPPPAPRPPRRPRPPSPPPPPRPTVDLHAPLVPVGGCVNGLLGINC